MRYKEPIAMIALFAAAPAVAQPVEVTAQVMAEQRQPAADGSTRISLVPASRVTPGDAVVYRIAYRNRGALPAADLVIANPVPVNLVYAGPAANSPAPDVSLDGTTFGPIGTLRVRGADGSQRAATPADVRAVRWRLSAPLPSGASGEVAFRATVK